MPTLYEVSDGDEVERHFSSKAEAIKYAKQIDRNRYAMACREAEKYGQPRPVRAHLFSCEVTMVTTPPLTLALLLNVLNSDGYVIAQDKVWPLT